MKDVHELDEEDDIGSTVADKIDQIRVYCLLLLADRQTQEGDSKMLQ